MKKPMKTVDQLIAHMKNKGICFSIISETDAKLHLDKASLRQNTGVLTKIKCTQESRSVLKIWGLSHKIKEARKR